MPFTLDENRPIIDEWVDITPDVIANMLELTTDAAGDFHLDAGRICTTSVTVEVTPEQFEAYQDRTNRPERRQGMTLTVRNTASYLERSLRTEKYPNGIILTQDFGNHAHCPLESNCPEAIKLRRFLKEAGLELPEILKGWEEQRKQDDNPPPPAKPNFPDFSGKLHISLGHQDIEVDFKEELERLLIVAYGNKVYDFRYAEEILQQAGHDLYHAYLHYIQEAKQTRILPQLALPLMEMVQYRCMATYATQDSYFLIFPIVYAPQWLFTHKDRYKLCKEHIESLRREVFMQFHIARNIWKIVEARLVWSNGEKFSHYHGDRSRDCWGDLKLPERWDETLESLANLSYSFQAALATINRDSLITGVPPGMPDVIDLIDKAKKLGKEDEKGGEPEEPNAEQEEEPGAPPRHWGREDTENPQGVIEQIRQEVRRLEDAEH